MLTLIDLRRCQKSRAKSWNECYLEATFANFAAALQHSPLLTTKNCAFFDETKRFFLDVLETIDQDINSNGKSVEDVSYEFLYELVRSRLRESNARFFRRSME